jgi:hypothetical protein
MGWADVRLMDFQICRRRALRGRSHREGTDANPGVLDHGENAPPRVSRFKSLPDDAGDGVGASAGYAHEKNAAFGGQAPVDGELTEVRIECQDDPSVRRSTTKDFSVGGSRLGRLDPLNVVADFSKGGNDSSRNVLVNQQAHYASSTSGSNG